MSSEPMRPTPMQPMLILLLGALAPRTEDGTIMGKANVAPVAIAPFRNPRREHFFPVNMVISFPA